MQSKKIAEAVSKTFLSRVFYCNRVFAHLHVRDIIAHLFTEYGRVEYQDLVGNCSNLSEPWDTHRPFQELVQRVQEIQELSNNGWRTISNEDIFDTIYTLAYNTYLFYDDFDKWEERKRNEKNWAKFQAQFQAAQLKFKRKQKVSTCTGGYHREDNLREMNVTHNALINLATSAAACR